MGAAFLDMPLNPHLTIVEVSGYESYNASVILLEYGEGVGMLGESELGKGANNRSGPPFHLKVVVGNVGRVVRLHHKNS
jgi:hypothetical protein